jgi:hypothetical protein
MLVSRFRFHMALVALCISGCFAQVRHAPGYDAKATMVAQELHVATARPCFRGQPCDLEVGGDSGTIHFSDVNASPNRPWSGKTNGFRVNYLGSEATCMHPAMTASPKTLLPLICTITSKDDVGVYNLELARDCAGGRLVRSNSSGEDALALQTDLVDVLGARFPQREVALQDEHGVVSFSDSDALGKNITLHTRRGRALARAELLAVVAFHRFLDHSGAVRRCRSQ